MNRTSDYAKKNDNKFVSLEDCSKIERELDWIDEKLVNVKFALDKIKTKIHNTETIMESTDDPKRKSELECYIDGMVLALNIIESEMNKIIRR